MNTKEIIDGYLGNTQVNSIYQGSELIWYRYDINLFAYGVKQDLSGDGQTLIRVGNMELHKTLPIQSKMRGCLLNDDGTVNYYLSNDSDYYKEDGITPSVLNGTDGNVMTEIPAFYVLEKDEDGFAYRYISEVQLPDFRYIPKQYIARYEAAINRGTNKLMSVINNSKTYRGGDNTSSWDSNYRSLLGMPYTYQRRSVYRTGARRDRSSKWNISTTLSDYTTQLLFTIEYATYNSQATFNSSLTAEGYKQGGLGAGVTNLFDGDWEDYNRSNPFIPCGYTAEFGNRTGVKDFVKPSEFGPLTTQVNRYRGIELPFGHIWKQRDGCVIELSENNTIAKYYIFDNPDYYADTKTANARYLCDIPSVDGYIKRFNKYTNIPSTIGGSDGSWSYDYAYIEKIGVGLRGFLSGGSACDILYAGSPYDSTYAGLGYSNMVYSPANTHRSIGARLTYCEENIIIQTEDIPIISLEITGGTDVLTGNTLQLGISYNPSNTTQQGVMWSSSDETKATVDSNGLVTTIAYGSVVITATSIVNGAITDTHNINIEIPIVGLTINGTTNIMAGSSDQFTITYNPIDTTEVGVVWTSSDQNVATIDSNGLVTGVSIGNVIITATSISNGAIIDTYSLEITPATINSAAYGVKQELLEFGGPLLRVGNPELHMSLPIQSKMRGCLLNDDGTVNYYLSNDNDLLKEDGITPSILDGTDGNVMTEIPSFYVLEKDEGGFAYTYISEQPLPEFKYIPKQYIGRYEAVKNRTTGKLMSIINTSTTYRGGDNTSAWDYTYRSLLGLPCTSEARNVYRTGARLNGSSKWNINTTLSDYVVALLFRVEYATYNSQAAFNSSLTPEGYKQGGLGAGVSNIEGGAWSNFNNINPFIPCGYTTDLGNRTGVKDFVMPSEYGTLTTQVNRYRGIELPFGHISKHRDGFVIELSENYTVVKYYIFDNPDNFADTKTANARYLCDMPATTGRVGIRNKYTNIVSTIRGGYYDYDRYYIKNDGAGTLRGLYSSGNASEDVSCGLDYSNAWYSPTVTMVHAGARLTYCDENIIIQTN